MNGYEYLMKLLKEEGFRMSEEETYFSFKYQGNNYVAFKNDGPFLQIVMVCNTRDYARNQLLEVCNTMNDNKFIIKFVVKDPMFGVAMSLSRIRISLQMILTQYFFS